MTTTVTDQLLRDLVVGSHAEGTTCLAAAPAIQHEHRVPLVAGTGGPLDVHTVSAALVARAICRAAGCERQNDPRPQAPSGSSGNASTAIIGRSAKPRRPGSRSPRWITAFWTAITPARCSGSATGSRPRRSTPSFASGWRGCRTLSPRPTAAPATAMSSRSCRPSSPSLRCWTDRTQAACSSSS
jgi:hypothetical protein